MKPSDQGWDRDLEALRARVVALGWRACTWEYAEIAGPHEYVLRGRTCPEETWRLLLDAIRVRGRRQRYRPTGRTFTYLMLDDRRYWTDPGWEVINRALEADVQDLLDPPLEDDVDPWRVAP